MDLLCVTCMPTIKPQCLLQLGTFPGVPVPQFERPWCRDYFKRLTLKGRNKIVTEEEHRVKRFFFKKPTDVSILKRQAEEQGEKMKIQAGDYVNTSQHMSKTVALRIIYEHGKVISPGINLVFFGFSPSFPYSHWYWIATSYHLAKRNKSSRKEAVDALPSRPYMRFWLGETGERVQEGN